MRNDLTECPAMLLPTAETAVGRRPLLLTSGLLLAAGVLALPLDCLVSGSCLAGHCPGAIREFLDVCEKFGHGLGLAVIIVAIYVLDPARRWGLPRVLGCAAFSGLTADLVKMLVIRTRPNAFHFGEGVLASFGGWFPFGAVDSSWQSFPSGHTAVAVGLAIGLSWLYPHGRRFFIALAVLVACQRVQGGVHFPSDVLAAAAIACLVGSVFLELGRFPGWMDRWEERLRARCPIHMYDRWASSRAR
jgi:membrane-associated phospholipid phosphatase